MNISSVGNPDSDSVRPTTGSVAGGENSHTEDSVPSSPADESSGSISPANKIISFHRKVPSVDQSLLDEAAIRSLRSDDSSNASMKINALALLMKVDGEIALNGGRADINNFVNQIKSLEKSYLEKRIPLIDSAMSAIRDNFFAKIASLVFIPPFAFLAMADAKTPARSAQADLSLAQRALVNSMIKNKQIEGVLNRTIEHLEFLNGLSVENVLNASEETNSDNQTASMMKLLLNYLLNDSERLELSHTGNLSETTLNSKLNNSNDNRIEMAKSKLNNLVEYLSGSTESIFSDIETSNTKSYPLIKFVGNLLGINKLYLNKKYESLTGRSIDPFLTETLKMSKKRVTQLSESLERTLANLGIIFKKTTNEIEGAFQVRNENQLQEEEKLTNNLTSSINGMLNSDEFRDSANALSDITQEVTKQIPVVLNNIGNSLSSAVSDKSS